MLSEAFEYTVLRMFGGVKGRVWALRPDHEPSTLLLAFRGARQLTNSEQVEHSSPERSLQLSAEH